MGAPFYVTCCFSLDVFKSLSLCLISDNLIVMSLDVGLLRVIFFDTLRLRGYGICFFTQAQKFSAIISLNKLLCSFLFLFSVDTCGVKLRISRISCLVLIHLHINRYLPLQLPAASGAKGRERMAVLSFPPFLVNNWSGNYQSQETHLWALPRMNRWRSEHAQWLQRLRRLLAGTGRKERVHDSQRGWSWVSLWTRKEFLPTCLSLDWFQSHQFIHPGPGTRPGDTTPIMCILVCLCPLSSLI